VAQKRLDEAEKISAKVWLEIPVSTALGDWSTWIFSTKSLTRRCGSFESTRFNPQMRFSICLQEMTASKQAA